MSLHVAHIITRLIIGGAQENTLHTVIDQQQMFGDRVTLITGPGIGPEGSLEEKARANQVDLRIIDASKRNLHPWQDWLTYRQTIATLRELKPDVVHTHSSKAGVLGRWAAKKLGIPCVHTIHGASFHHGQSAGAFGLYRWLEQRCGPLTDQFISVCDSMTEQYVAARVAPHERFTTVYSGFDVEPFLQPPRPPEEVRRELGLKPEHIVIGKVARLFNLKGHEYVIRAAPEVIRRHPNVRFLFVGDGSLRKEFEAQIAAMGLAEHFVFAGLVPPMRVPELIHAMEIVVHTSVWEGLARVLPQGLIAGKPVVSYDVDGAREVVIPNETGHLLPRESIVELSAALCDLVADPEKRQRFGSTGRARFTQQFRHQFMTEKIREVYFDVLRRRGERRA